MKISRNTGRNLARFGRVGELPRLQTNKLVTQGIYKYMRHPMHLGLMLFPFAFAFLVGSITFIFVIAPAEVIFILFMLLMVEEPEIIEKFDNEYWEYMKTTPAFCFKLKCLKELLFYNSI
jgi:protein-S-isoprenylcysteine O-methyltransferase Ste14